MPPSKRSGTPRKPSGRARGPTIKTGTIRQTVELPAPPAAVYAALMTTRGHEGFSGAPARISTKVGGAFMAWGGYIHGKNVELVPAKRIVQAWRPSEETWPKGHDSMVTFDLSPTRSGTRVKFTHADVPAEHVEHLRAGWYESYWEPLKTYLARTSPV